MSTEQQSWRSLQSLGEVAAQVPDRIQTCTVLVQVDSRASLAAAWEEDASWLRRELKMWLKPGCDALLGRLWPHMLAEAVAAPAAESKKAVKWTGKRKKDGPKQSK